MKAQQLLKDGVVEFYKNYYIFIAKFVWLAGV